MSALWRSQLPHASAFSMRRHGELRFGRLFNYVFDVVSPSFPLGFWRSFTGHDSGGFAVISAIV
jgi:hypothetical protein